jgi:hypothetical protein
MMILEPLPTIYIAFMAVATIYMLAVGYRWKGWRAAVGGVAFLWVTFAVTRFFVMSAEPLANEVAAWLVP